VTSQIRAMSPRGAAKQGEVLGHGDAARTVVASADDAPRRLFSHGGQSANRRLRRASSRSIEHGSARSGERGPCRNLGIVTQSGAPGTALSS
jgi:hypothetical protein